MAVLVSGIPTGWWQCWYQVYLLAGGSVGIRYIYWLVAVLVSGISTGWWQCWYQVYLLAGGSVGIRYIYWLVAVLVSGISTGWWMFVLTVFDSNLLCEG